MLISFVVFAPTYGASCLANQRTSPLQLPSGVLGELDLLARLLTVVYYLLLVVDRQDLLVAVSTCPGEHLLLPGVTDPLLARANLALGHGGLRLDSLGFQFHPPDGTKSAFLTYHCAVVKQKGPTEVVPYAHIYLSLCLVW